MAYPTAPPLLLTRRLSSFLHASLESLQEHKDQKTASATLQTALLVTPSGNLLAYESPLPVRTLRTHCSVAASLWTIHASSSPSVAVALEQTVPVNKSPTAPLSSPSLLPLSSTGDIASPVGEDHKEDQYHDGSSPVSIAASFNGGAVFVVQRLRCGLLFACSTPSPSGNGSRPSTAVDPAGTLSVIDPTPPLPTPNHSTSATAQSSLLPQSTLPRSAPPLLRAAAATSQSRASVLSASSPSDSPTPINLPPKQLPDRAGSLVPDPSARIAVTADTYEADPSSSHGRDVVQGRDTDRAANADAASMTSTGTTTTTVGGGSKKGSVAVTLAIARRQVDELARLLDEKLGSLSVPEDNIGINGFC